MVKLKSLNLLEKKRKMELHKTLGEIALILEEVLKLNDTISRIEELIFEEEQREEQKELSGRYLRNSRELRHKLYERLNISKNRARFLDEQIQSHNSELANIKLKLKRLESKQKTEKKLLQEEKQKRIEIAEARGKVKKT